jgi:chemotaxis protein CheX
MVSLSTDTEALIVDAVDRSLSEAFEMMVGTSVRRLGEQRRREPIEEPNHRDGLTVVMGMTGELQGSIVVCLSVPAALKWTQQIIDHDTETVDQMVIDGVGELANIVVGSTKRLLGSYDLKMGLPSVVRADKQNLAFPTRTASIQLDYEYDGTDLSVVIALAEKPSF